MTDEYITFIVFILAKTLYKAKHFIQLNKMCHYYAKKAPKLKSL
jgi:predicted cupin superfamily sugar epimerase